MRPIVAREGWPLAAGLGALTVLAGLVWPYAAVVPGALTALVLWFFRDPERTPAGGERDVVAPADGRVLWVRNVEEPRFLGGPAVGVSIFLSIFDVHINRAPVAGRVAYQEHVPGRFEAAWKERVEERNERAYTGLEGPDYRVLVVQIAGLVARRIVTWARPDQILSRGERFGLIKFGSCTQVYLPPGTEITVRPGQRVLGGQTVIGRLPSGWERPVVTRRAGGGSGASGASAEAGGSGSGA